jgi:hypothetical protein
MHEANGSDRALHNDSIATQGASARRLFAFLAPAFFFDDDLAHLLAAQSEFIANSLEKDAFQPASVDGLIALGVPLRNSPPAVSLGGQLCTAFALRHGFDLRVGDSATLRQIPPGQMDK